MTATIDKPHVLVIGDIGDGEKEWHIVHPATCSWDAYRYSDTVFGIAGAADESWHFHRTCLTQWEVDSNGLDSLEVYSVEDVKHLSPSHVAEFVWEAGWHRLLPGRYEIKASSSWSGSWYDEVDAEFYISRVVSLDNDTIPVLE